MTRTTITNREPKVIETITQKDMRNKSFHLIRVIINISLITARIMEKKILTTSLMTTKEKGKEAMDQSPRVTRWKRAIQGSVVCPMYFLINSH